MGVAVDFGASRKAAESAGLLGSGNILKLKEGGNRLRLMTECLPHQGTYKGTKNFKWLCYVIDRTDGKLKPYFMPHSIYKQIEALQMDDEYKFTTVPMPYDLILNAKGAGTKEVEYTIIPRKETPITALEHQELATMKPLREYQTELRQKEAEKQNAAEPPPVDDGQPITADEIPF